MTPEKNDKKLTHWLLAAAIALLILVLGLQLWQMSGRKAYGGNGSPTPDSANGPAVPQAAAVSPGKTAMIEDVQALNPALSFDDLAALSAEELEQLYEAGAPGLPVGVSAAAQAAGAYAGTLELDSVTSETDPELDEVPARYEVELRHPTLGDFEYQVDAYTGQVLEGVPDILRSLQDAGAPQTAPEGSGGQDAAAGSRAPDSGAQKPVSGTPGRQAYAGGEEAAKSAAFAHAGVSAEDAASVRCELDWDDGRQVYGVGFWAGNTEYDYEIDASTGAVLEARQERDGHHAGASQSGGFIGEEAAKSAALTHAGVSAQDAEHIRLELDRDDGVPVYEIEFTAGGAEYEYEIDAADGTVRKAELD